MTKTQASWVALALWPFLDPKSSEGRQYAEFCEAVSSAITTTLDEIVKPWSSTTPAGLHFLATIRPSPTMTHEALVNRIQQTYKAQQPNDTLTLAAIHKVARLLVRCWTMTTVDLESNLTQSLRPARSWEKTQTLAAVVESQLHALEKASEACGVRILDKDLSAANLKRYQDVRIKWVFDITDHLALTSWNGTLTLSVFEHKIWAKSNRMWPDSCGLPKEVLQELMLTLNLLFPSGDARTERLLKDCKKDQITAMGNCGVPKDFDLSRYKYWRARLAELDVLLNAEQRGFRQVWRLDKQKHNLMGVFLFWVSGVAVLVLTVISSVCGIMSLLIAQRQVRQADDAYRLALAQACADPDVRDGLSDFCR